MRISAWDILSESDRRVELNVHFTTDHPASYGQPVMSVDEWDGDVMDHQNWILAGCEIEEASEQEIRLFKQWYSLIDLYQGNAVTFPGGNP